MLLQSFKSLWTMKHKLVQTPPKISERIYWNPQEEVTKAVQAISMYFPALFSSFTKTNEFSWPRKKESPDLYTNKQTTYLRYKITHSRSLEWHQNRRQEISTKASS